ncbi:MAG: N-terminal Xaa-Pro-Lys N-methyltransferase 1 [archaeon]|nr:N-terminal Xaa-Pro-Lys N-methyltransferase 1 [archaeon]
MEFKTKPSKEERYFLRKVHWESKEATIKAVLGGWGETHLPDVKCSNELISGLIKTNILNPGRALDCAAGIGRVTQFVLVNFFEEIELFEQDSKFVNKAKELLSSNKKVKGFYNESLENFDFKNKTNYYDLIWIQWTLENIEDDDLDTFLKKCYNALTDKGLIIVKENIFVRDEYDGNKKYDVNNIYSQEDLSKQREDIYYIKLFNKNGFNIYRHFLNPNWPQGIMPMVVYVLKKK